MKGEINAIQLPDETANLRSQFVTSSWGGAQRQMRHRIRLDSESKNEIF